MLLSMEKCMAKDNIPSNTSYNGTIENMQKISNFIAYWTEFSTLIEMRINFVFFADLCGISSRFLSEFTNSNCEWNFFIENLQAFLACGSIPISSLISSKSKNVWKVKRDFCFFISKTDAYSWSLLAFVGQVLFQEKKKIAGTAIMIRWC